MGPTIALTYDPSKSNQILFKLSDASSNFSLNSVSVTGGTLKYFGGVNDTYSAFFYLTANSTIGNAVINVASGAFTDSAGNANADGAEANNTITIPVPPTIAVTYDALTSRVDFKLSGASPNFSLNSVTVTGGTLKYFSGVHNTFAAMFFPDEKSSANGTIKVASGAFTDEAGNANADGADANNTVTVVNTNNNYTGTAAADTITNSPVSQNIDGGAGIDTLVYSSTSTPVVISKSGGNTVVTNTVTGEVDTLINVERLKFADTAIALDTGGVGGQAYRVYQAAFNRTPDLGGLGYWIGGMDSGASLKNVAQGFVNSAEFKAVYGSNPTNELFVAKLYDNVLHRAPDLGGYNYWLGILNSGQGTAADVLAAFSESPENQSGVISVIEKGMRYTPYVSPTYSLSASATAVNEGAVATFTLRTTNVAAGTSIGYTLSVQQMYLAAHSTAIQLLTQVG
jgi:hypothetical protein